MTIQEADLTLFDVPGKGLAAAVEIHPTAIVHKGAEIVKGVKIGPYCIVGPKARLGDNVQLTSHALVENRTVVGDRCVIHSFAVIGAHPQDLKFQGEDAELVIGEENSFRLYCNVAIGTQTGGGKTQIGRRNLFMSSVHVAHDCQIGDNNIVASGASVAGHVDLGSNCVVGGMVGIHQFCHVGSRAMIGGGSIVVQDVPPYTMVQGDRAVPVGLNTVGLKRAGFTSDAIKDIKTMYRLLYNESLTVEDCIKRIETEVPDSDHRRHFVGFLRSSERGVCR
jgi:UDP-N-acetylglucosamine acyltransferase